MLLTLWWTLSIAGPCEQAGRPALAIVCPYLQALQALDHRRMSEYWAPAVTSVSRSGAVRLVNREVMQDMRAFERSLNTRWSFRVEAVAGDTVTVTLGEANDFYEALGVGPRTQTEVYVVGTGQIVQMRTLTLRHVRGTYDSAYTAFKTWLLSTEASRDTTLVQGAALRFTGPSGEHLRPWLRRWRMH